MSKFAGVIGAGVLALLVASGAAAQAPRLTLGVFPGLESAESFEILERYLPFAQYLGAKSGAVVILVPIKVPGPAIRRMIENGASYKLFFGPPVFAAEVIKKADFVTIAVEQERIRGVFVVKAGSNLKSVQDFEPNTRVAMPSPKLLLAILALASLEQEKIVLQPQARHHLDSAEGMLLALNNGVVDVAVMRDRLGQKIAAEKPSVYRIVGQTLDGPGFALIAHRSVSEQLRGKLRQAAMALNSDPSPLAVRARERLRTSPFLPGKEGEFLALQRMMETPSSAN
jgi:ABC-type phosphate/phosphonate transport system substrate-binding protein